MGRFSSKGREGSGVRNIMTEPHGDNMSKSDAHACVEHYKRMAGSEAEAPPAQSFSSREAAFIGKGCPIG